MPATRIRHLSPTADFPGPWSGRAPGEAIPLRHLEAWVQEARRRILVGGTEQEADSAMVAGGEGLAITYTDQLTEIEQARDELAAWRALGQESREWIGREGESRVSQADFRRFVERMSALLGNSLTLDPAAVGTQGPAAGPVTPNTNEPPPAETEAQRRARFDELLKQSGFKWPEQSIEISNMAVQNGFTLDEVNRWAAPGA